MNKQECRKVTHGASPREAYLYANDVLKAPWPQAEPYIAKDPYWAYQYAKNVLKAPFPKAEPYIAKDPQWAYQYARDVLKAPWPKVEPTIAKDPYWAYFYTRDVLKAPYINIDELKPGTLVKVLYDGFNRQWVLDGIWPIESIDDTFIELNLPEGETQRWCHNDFLRLATPKEIVKWKKSKGA